MPFAAACTSGSRRLRKISSSHFLNFKTAPEMFVPNIASKVRANGRTTESMMLSNTVFQPAMANENQFPLINASIRSITFSTALVSAFNGSRNNSCTAVLKSPSSNRLTKRSHTFLIASMFSLRPVVLSHISWSQVGIGFSSKSPSTDSASLPPPPPPFSCPITFSSSQGASSPLTALPAPLAAFSTSSNPLTASS